MYALFIMKLISFYTTKYVQLAAHIDLKVKVVILMFIKKIEN